MTEHRAPTSRRQCATAAPLLTALMTVLVTGWFANACAPAQPAAPGAGRSDLDSAFLLGRAALSGPVPTSAFQPQSAGLPAQRLEGRIEIVMRPGAGRMKIIDDWFDYARDANLAIADLPAFRFDFVQQGADLLPMRRGPQRSAHPHWEFILEPGRVWDEAGDGGYSRAALPFALQERNANCTHNGLMTFLFRSDGRISRVAYQVASETCQYLKVDLWGVLPAHYEAVPVEGRDAAVEAYRREVTARMPVKPLAALALDYPASYPGAFEWYPREETSSYGFAIDGIHYSGGCATRFGPYPFCEVLDLPSYSLAKSIFAGAAFMLLEQSYPGAGALAVNEYVPECAAAGGWQGVTLEHLLDMSSGRYQSLEKDADEYASYETDFMGGDRHVQKIGVACSLFPRRGAPAERFAYHSSDTYIAGTLMNAFLDERAGSGNTPQAGEEPTRDIHELLVEKLYAPLRLSPVMRSTRRSYDSIAQPFGGYGLTLHSDDIVRLGLFLGRGEGSIDGRPVLDRKELNAALQRNPQDRGLTAYSEDLRYNNGFWAYLTDLEEICSEPVWIPFMSGYGGITVALFPNGTVFYMFSDHGRHEWLKAAIASNALRRFCK